MTRPRETVYSGLRSADGVEVMRNGRALSATRSRGVRNHSPSGFEWGYGGSGPAQLALALVLDVLADDVEAVRCYQWVKWASVANWSGDAWSITAGELLDLVDQWRRECAAADAAAAPVEPYRLDPSSNLVGVPTAKGGA